MAAAYLFHISQNHPFVDGNKRTGANAAITFLMINDWEPDISEDELVDLVLSVASRHDDEISSHGDIRGSLPPRIKSSCPLAPAGVSGQSSKCVHDASPPSQLITSPSHHKSVSDRYHCGLTTRLALFVVPA